MREVYKYRYWFLFTAIVIIGFLSGIAVGLNAVNG
ncbi:hypothetical protein AKUH4B101A_14380 [Apilactobacillus kunkeei]|nr:hypothetical protein AKUH4B403J_14340 [Apilactobacillus kunkeei]CAI2665114.1 hypothetical protein AKUH4B103J_14380 [Apilactobacillus kunkeei]CAI2665533.1 hypothetical protein AKUH4B203M_14440 [Apilactobacillus kunkeei]CAI2668632.1 hypothetical protein AKUH4B303J_14570 [Apilactobacillus kunkeei]CAI2668643.1 hypothetical protein AKUH4B116J_14340 [Apilactobacillus kunkeei]